MKLLVPEDNYPDSYWFLYDFKDGPDYLIFSDCEVVSTDAVPRYRLKGNFSLEKIREYDYLFSDGPNFVSEKLMLNFADLGLGSCAQFIRAEVSINNVSYDDYYVINYLKSESAFDLSKSDYSPLIKSIPDGPVKFRKIVLKRCEPSSEIFRAQEGRMHIVLSDSRAAEFEIKKIKGVRFVHERDKI